MTLETKLIMVTICFFFSSNESRQSFIFPGKTAENENDDFIEKSLAHLMEEARSSPIYRFFVPHECNHRYWVSQKKNKKQKRVNFLN